jgi:hypothetical protein
MGIMDQVWNTLATVIKMNDKIDRLVAKTDLKQAKIEGLTERVIRIEAAMEIAMSGSLRLGPPKA